MTIDPRLLSSLAWRCVGPHRGGRVVAVAGHPSEPMTFYFGACAGGVWKTTDGGTYWENVSDGFFETAAVGALAVAASDPNVVYAGTGEACIRGNVSHGDGVYRSTDGGRTWTNVGLRDTRHIGRVRVHPRDPDLVYVAALGHAWGPNRERGVFRSRNGGAAWEQVLFRSERAGAVDLSMDSQNPRVLYAAIWEAQRTPWSMTSGGPDSSLWKSTDGGDTWTDISRNPGLPRGVLGRIGVAVSPADGRRVYAVIEAADGALFRSDDGGATWQRGSEEARPPRAPLVLHARLRRSHGRRHRVGGRLLAVEVHRRRQDVRRGGHAARRQPRPLDRPREPPPDDRRQRRRGLRVVQRRAVVVDHLQPADRPVLPRVRGRPAAVPDLRLPAGQLGHQPAEPVAPGRHHRDRLGPAGRRRERLHRGEARRSGHRRGRLHRHRARHGAARPLRSPHAGRSAVISVWPEAYGMGVAPAEHRYRFQWTFPVFYSRWDPRELWIAGNRVFRSVDEGHSWEVVSPDLTRNDPAKLGLSGGPITRDNTGAEIYCTIFALAESPHERGVLWAGTDDGLVHLSRDRGSTWERVTPPELPEWALVSVLEPSPHDPATCYVAATCYKLDDPRPYLFKTSDYGRTWKRITNGLPEGEITRVIREDPHRRGLLYCGTETGVWVSLDDGGSWQRLRANLPVAPIHDLIVKDTDLVVATHGRSFWILDDLTPLHQMTEAVAAADAHLFAPRPTVRWRAYRGHGMKPGPGREVAYRLAGSLGYAFREVKAPTGEKRERPLDAGENPPSGVVVHYWLKEAPAGRSHPRVPRRRGTRDPVVHEPAIRAGSEWRGRDSR